MPERTLHRYAPEVLGHGRASRAATVRVGRLRAGRGEPGRFGKVGLLPAPPGERRRVVNALTFAAVYSRHCFVYGTVPNCRAQAEPSIAAAHRIPEPETSPRIRRTQRLSAMPGSPARDADQPKQQNLPLSDGLKHRSLLRGRSGAQTGSDLRFCAVAGVGFEPT
jgi:hypothetical protein